MGSNVPLRRELENPGLPPVTDEPAGSPGAGEATDFAATPPGAGAERTPPVEVEALLLPVDRLLDEVVVPNDRIVVPEPELPPPLEGGGCDTPPPPPLDELPPLLPVDDDEPPPPLDDPPDEPPDDPPLVVRGMA